MGVKTIEALQLSDIVHSRRLFFFGHLHRTDPSQDHYRALQACILGPLDDWRRRIGRPRQSWLRTVEADLRPMNLGLATSKRCAQDRSAWRKLVIMATSTTSSWRRRRRSWQRIDHSLRQDDDDVSTKHTLFDFCLVSNLTYVILQGDENDPELAYRDIAKFNIVQVAGKCLDL